MSSHPEIASVNANTGEAKAIKTGISKISNGELSGVVEVTRVAKIAEVGTVKYRGSAIEATYQVLWQGKDSLEELPHLGLRGSIDNNFQPNCVASSKYLTTITQIVQ